MVHCHRNNHSIHGACATCLIEVLGFFWQAHQLACVPATTMPKWSRRDVTLVEKEVNPKTTIAPERNHAHLKLNSQSFFAAASTIVCLKGSVLLMVTKQ